MMIRYNRYSLIRSFALFVGLLVISSLGYAQSTVVSGTVTDNLGTIWSNGTITAVFYPTPGYPPPFNWSGGAYNPFPPAITLSPTGTFTITLPSNNAIAPGGSQWTFTVCPNATFTCASVNIPLTAPTIDISSLLTTAIGSTIIQPIVQPTPVNSAYGNNEVKSPPAWGHLYFDTTLKVMKFWNGSTWVIFSSGFVPTIAVTTAILKGDGLGNAIAAIPGTDYIAPTLNTSQHIQQTSGSYLGVNNFNHILYASEWCTIIATPDQSCLSNAITAIGSNQNTLVINTQIPITSLITVPTNVSLSLVGSGGFVLSAGGTLIIGGPFDASTQQVFSGAGLGNVYFYGSSSNISVLPQWFGANGNSKAGGVNATAGNATLTLRPLADNNWNTGDVVTIVGAGVSGANYQATLTVTGGVITASPVPSTTIADTPMYTHDDSQALNAWTNSVRGNTVLGIFYDNRSGFGPARLYMPKGEYQVCTTPVLIYTSVVLEAEAGQTNTGGSFSQCNPSISVLKIAPWNFDPQGVPHNWGNGNSYFKHVQIRGNYNAGSITRFPTIQYLNASNINSDNRWDHPMFESVNGPGYGLGFITTGVGTIAAGATSMTIADASTFCSASFATSISQPCNQVVIVGAGAAGANLVVTFTAGGTLPAVPLPGNPSGASYTVNFTPATSTSVTNPQIFPAQDVIGNLTIEHAEMDGGQIFILGQGNSTGNIVVDDSEIFNANNGGFINTSLNGFSLDINHITCQGCGVTSAGGSSGSAITWTDPANLKKLSINIRNSQFLPLFIGGNNLGGNIVLSGANNINISNNRFYNIDTIGATKLLFLQNAFDIHVSDNQAFWDTTFNGDWGTSHLMEINDTNSLTPTTSITNNSFLNNSATNFPLGISPDIPLTGAVVTGNIFSGSGTYTTLYASNIANNSVRNTFQTQNFVMQKQGTSPPSTGTWQPGDVVWNSAPSSGQPLLWICIAAPHTFSAINLP